MKNLLLIILLCWYSSLAVAKTPIKVAVLDTGYDFKSTWSDIKYKTDKNGMFLKKPKLCKFGHKDFTNTGIQDTHGHGTHVTGIIAKFAGNSNYCIVIIKIWDENISGTNALKAVTKALVYARRIGVDIINYSGGGSGFNIEEYHAVKKVLNKGIVFVAAAGNDGKKINHHVLKVDVEYKYEAKGKLAVYSFKPYYIDRKTSEVTTNNVNTYFPASYDPRIISVKNTNINGELIHTSNKGNAFIFQEIGDKILSISLNNSYAYMTGTSQAAPTRTGKIIKRWIKK